MSVAVIVCIALMSLVFVFTLPIIFFAYKRRKSYLGFSLFLVVLSASIIVLSYTLAFFYQTL